MSKKSDLPYILMPIVLLLGFLILAGVLYAVAKSGLFQLNIKSGDTYVSGDVINILSDADNEPSMHCKLELDNNLICVGDDVTGKITNGEDHLCWVYGYVRTDSAEGWYLLFEGYTDRYGLLEETRRIMATGSIRFRAICDLNDNGVPDMDDCITNFEDLRVIVCNPPSDDSTDSDDDTDSSQDSDSSQDNDQYDNPYDYPVCQSSYPYPTSQADCKPRPGCNDNLCVIAYGDLTKMNKCECVSPSCDSLCRFEGYLSGVCRDGNVKNPCPSAVVYSPGNKYCGSLLDFKVCCCNY